MAYIGNEVTSIPFITDTFSGTGGQTAFTLTRAPAGTASIAVFISGVYQPPGNYTLSGTTLNFAIAPSSGTNNIVVLHLGNGSAVQVPSDGSVTISKLSSDVYGYINAAFAVANSDTAVSNSGAIYANSGFAVANSAASYANSAFSYANSAFLVANNGVGIDVTQNTNITSAASYANSAFLAANTPGISNGQLSVVSSAVGVIADSAAGRLPYKILGQIQTTANVLTTIYTVPAATNTMITTITICNQSSNDSVLINVAANISGSAVTTRNFIVSGYPLGGAETLVLEPRISLNVGSILSANITGANASSNISINAFGVEII
jgi:hypothetical protein